MNTNTTRREFLSALALSGAWSCCPRSLSAADDGGLLLEHDRIEVGTGRTFCALHVSDSHIATLFDWESNRFPERAGQRTAQYFPTWERSLSAELAYARRNGLPILHTGDVIDFASEANVRRMKDLFAGQDIFACLGNHEYQFRMGMDEELRLKEHPESVERYAVEQALSSFWPNDITVASRVIGGVNFVAFDNVHSQIYEKTACRLRAELRRNLPTVLLCHVPFYEPELFERASARTGNHTAYVMGVPPSILMRYPEINRREQGSDERTLDFVEELRHAPNIRAVLAGHVHFPFKSRFSPTAVQYVCGLSARSEARLLTFV